MNELFHLMTCDLFRIVDLVYPNRSRSDYDTLVLCPRSHAEAHLRYIVEVTLVLVSGTSWSLQDAKEQFSQVNRLFPGDDLVFAVGDVQ